MISAWTTHYPLREHGVDRWCCHFGIQLVTGCILFAISMPVLCNLYTRSWCMSRVSCVGVVWVEFACIEVRVWLFISCRSRSSWQWWYRRQREQHVSSSWDSFRYRGVCVSVCACVLWSTHCLAWSCSPSAGWAHCMGKWVAVVVQEWSDVSICYSCVLSCLSGTSSSRMGSVVISPTHTRVYGNIKVWTFYYGELVSLDICSFYILSLSPCYLTCSGFFGSVWYSSSTSQLSLGNKRLFVREFGVW